MLKALLPLLALLAFVGVVYVVLRKFGLLSGNGRAGPGEPQEPAYRRKQHLLTKGELAFYRALMEAVADRYVVMVKVRLADLVEPSVAKTEWTAAFNRVSAKHVDFVLCDLDAIAPVLAIELDDASHGADHRREADTRKDRALESAGLPLLRVRAASSYAASQIQRRIEAGVKGASVAARADSVQAARPSPR